MEEQTKKLYTPQLPLTGFKIPEKLNWWKEEISQLVEYHTKVESSITTFEYLLIHCYYMDDTLK